MNIEHALVFSILTQDIKNLSTIYIDEKHYLCNKYEDPTFLLDSKNKDLFKEIYSSCIELAREYIKNRIAAINPTDETSW